MLRKIKNVVRRVAFLRNLVYKYYSTWQPSLKWELLPDAEPFGDRGASNDLERYFANNTGREIDKWIHYFEAYDRHLERYRGRDVHVLEFGVSRGGSLQMWRDYFGPDAKIYGVDIEPSCAAFAEDGTKIFIGDQADRQFLRSLAKEIPQLDILIDDGGHTMRQQITTFEELFPHISPDGTYVCEDLHTSYWRRFGGGFPKRGTFIEYSKGLIDKLNAWHSEHTAKLSPDDFTRSAYSMHFYDSMLFIEKRVIPRPSHQRRGKS